MPNISEKAFALMEETYKTKLTEREKMLAHVYYGLVVLMEAEASGSTDEELPK
ncbi:hypothetical protein [Cohnella sp. GCM10012308]|uniref:hypothetical protein n=1 Tax=Cohnella sp. GCM10012308 TaxID=3317329 RepID=UPI00360FD8B1